MSRIPLKAVLRELNRRGEVRFAEDPKKLAKILSLLDNLAKRTKTIHRYALGTWGKDRLDEYSDILVELDGLLPDKEIKFLDNLQGRITAKEKELSREMDSVADKIIQFKKIVESRNR